MERRREPPSAFVCPLTHKLLVDPVIAPDDMTYERTAIEKWLAEKATSPWAGDPMPPGDLAPNNALREQISAWKTDVGCEEASSASSWAPAAAAPRLDPRPLAIHPSQLTLARPEQLIGEGSFGKVVVGTLATDHGKPIEVAVKILTDVTQAEANEFFDKELRAHATAQQGSDGVCRLLGTCEKDGELCLIMRRYKRTLFERIAEGIEKEDIRRIGHSLFRTLAEVHAAGVVVQDIKPENILLDSSDNAFISDFGLSDVMRRTMRVRHGHVQGTWCYMAPEQFASDEFGPEVDVWAMACVIIQMVTRVSPWGDLASHRIQHKVFIQKKRPKVPAHVPEQKLIEQCFAYQAGDRPTAADLASALGKQAGVRTNRRRRRANHVKDHETDAGPAASEHSIDDTESTAPVTPTPASALTEQSAPAAPLPRRKPSHAKATKSIRARTKRRFEPDEADEKKRARFDGCDVFELPSESDFTVGACEDERVHGVYYSIGTRSLPRYVNSMCPTPSTERYHALTKKHIAENGVEIGK